MEIIEEVETVSADKRSAEWKKSNINDNKEKNYEAEQIHERTRACSVTRNARDSAARNIVCGCGRECC